MPIHLREARGLAPRRPGIWTYPIVYVPPYRLRVRAIVLACPEAPPSESLGTRLMPPLQDASSRTPLGLSIPSLGLRAWHTVHGSSTGSPSSCQHVRHTNSGPSSSCLTLGPVTGWAAGKSGCNSGFVWSHTPRDAWGFQGTITSNMPVDQNSFLHSSEPISKVL